MTIAPDLLADETLRGRAFCQAYSQRIDEWLGGLWADAGSPAEAALVAVGGHGRRELSPGSDLDLLIVHRRSTDIEALAEKIWYPVWDEKLKLGHAVRTVDEALALADDDLDTATALLDARPIAGDAELVTELAEAARRRFRNRANKWLSALADRTAIRHRDAGEVAFLVEPDLKNGRGGLRDVHTVGWVDAARPGTVGAQTFAALEEPYAHLLEVRVELHRVTGSSSDRMPLQEQDSVAEVLAAGDADALMNRVASAARTIAWATEEVFDTLGAEPGGMERITGTDQSIGLGLILRHGQVHLSDDADPTTDPTLMLRAGVEAAERGLRIDRASLAWLDRDAPALSSPWSSEVRGLFVRLLLAGRPAVRVIENLDHHDLMVRILPEWAQVRCKPQRNAYHTFTIDRHLCEAAANASGLTAGVGRPDLLVVGALLHDIGKGRSGDHTEIGMELVAEMGPRMGFDATDTAVLVDLVRLHLLLPEVATRRDLSDHGTIRSVADAVGSVTVLELLDALTEADSLATGPSAWSRWKAGLVRELVGRTRHVLEGGRVGEVAPEFPTADHRDLMARGERAVRVDCDLLTVIDADRPGLFASVAGVMALNGLEVLAANAHTQRLDGRDVALCEFRVMSSFAEPIDWDAVRADLDRALSARLALDARLARRDETYGARGGVSAVPSRVAVVIDNDLSDVATVVEVHGEDRVALLYRITRALADLRCDLRSARVQTLGRQVVDTFYLLGSDGQKITDSAMLAEIDLSLRHVLTAQVHHP
ncbi:MAG: [protein-PII] uridylyltransferase [Actinomycetia bacterium]|nr:[protein-PII] uridylyltransferase [Actinomycetes bacterium]